MQVILLEKIAHVGDLGDVVKVKDGYGRNFLIPTGRARHEGCHRRIRSPSCRARSRSGRTYRCRPEDRRHDQRRRNRNLFQVRR